MRTEDVTTLMQQAAELLDDSKRNKEPILITRDGRPATYLADVESYEFQQRRASVLEGILRTEMAVADGRPISHADAKARLGR